MLVAVSGSPWLAPPSAIYCNDEQDCRIHCPVTHQGECTDKQCTCNINPTYFCNDASDCRVHCPYTHEGVCNSNKCACKPIPGTFFCNDDLDCRIHCPFTHVGKCQTEVTNNHTCTCNYHPTIHCSSDFGCRIHCPVTHRGSCKSDKTCSCDPIPTWLLPSTPAQTIQSTTTRKPTTTEQSIYCINSLDCSVHCPDSHKGVCRADSTCVCDPHVSGKPVSCRTTTDCIHHCWQTHVGTCSTSTHTCRCLVGS